MRKTIAFADHQRKYQRRNAGADVDDRAAREVEHGDFPAERPVEITALAPDHVAQRKIDQRHPNQHEGDIRAEFHAFRHRAADERRRDDGEHHLEQHEGLRRNRPRVIRIRGRADALQEQVRERVAANGVARREGHAVAENHPQRRDQRHQNQAVHHRGEHVFAPHEAAVKQDQSRRGHHQHQRRASEQPRVVAGVHGDQRRGGGLDLRGVFSSQSRKTEQQQT